MASVPNIATAVKALAPTAEFGVSGNTYAGITWLTPDVPKPSEADVQAELARQTAQLPVEKCLNDARALLAATDWSVLPDVNLVNKADFTAYRAAVRAIANNPVANPVFPAVPNPVWA